MNAIRQSVQRRASSDPYRKRWKTLIDQYDFACEDIRKRILSAFPKLQYVRVSDSHLDVEVEERVYNIADVADFLGVPSVWYGRYQHETFEIDAADGRSVKKGLAREWSDQFSKIMRESLELTKEIKRDVAKAVGSTGVMIIGPLSITRQRNLWHSQVSQEHPLVGWKNGNRVIRVKFYVDTTDDGASVIQDKLLEDTGMLFDVKTQLTTHPKFEYVWDFKR